jgi:hypothetical protein
MPNGYESMKCFNTECITLPTKGFTGGWKKSVLSSAAQSAPPAPAARATLPSATLLKRAVIAVNANVPAGSWKMNDCKNFLAEATGLVPTTTLAVALSTVNPMSTDTEILEALNAARGNLTPLQHIEAAPAGTTLRGSAGAGVGGGARANAGFRAGSSAGASARAGASAHAGSSAGATAGAKAGKFTCLPHACASGGSASASAGASVGPSVGASAGGSAGASARAGAGASAGPSVGASEGAGAGAGIEASNSPRGTSTEDAVDLISPDRGKRTPPLGTGQDDEKQEEARAVAQPEADQEAGGVPDIDLSGSPEQKRIKTEPT